MIIRLSAKLAARFDFTPPKILPLDDNPLADWSGHVFTAARTQFMILTNTASLYSTVFYGRGIPSDNHFIESAMSSLRDLMEADGLSFIYQQFIAPASATVQFSKALNRSVTGSMNDLVLHAKRWLIEEDLSPHDTSFKLNDIPFSALKYRKPRDVFAGLMSDFAPGGFYKARHVSRHKGEVACRWCKHPVALPRSFRACSRRLIPLGGQAPDVHPFPASLSNPRGIV